MKKLFHLIQVLQRYINRCRASVFNFYPDISIGKNTVIEKGVILSTRAGGSITIGSDCYLSSGAQIITWGGDIVIGNNTSLNPYTVIYGQGGTRIGNGVRIAAHCLVVPSNHKFDDLNTYIYKQGLSKKGIIIEDNVWLGAGVKVLDGVRISYGSVVGANAVVTKDTEPNSINVGIPSRKIKDR